ncbi:MAG: hypothetical protein JRD89_20500 [Deltaproteobacteria bacterium]|nr:hypothetical protein [Deltaproteobacteria bacterium]
MSIIRPWTNGDQVALSGLGEVPVVQADKSVLLYDANGLPWVQDANLGMPINIVGVTPNEDNGAMPVNKQDAHTEIIDLFLSRFLDDLTILADVAIDDDTADIETTGVVPVIGDAVCFKDVDGVAFYQGEIITVVPIAGNQYTITVDSPFDFAFTTADGCSLRSNDLGVDGSVTRVPFVVSPGGLAPGVEWDITRTFCTILSSNSMDDGRFGSAAALTRGLLLRSVNGVTKNIFNAKKNGDFQLRTGDRSYADKAPAGQYSVSFRRSFNGDDKNGVTLRLEGDTDDVFVYLVQDDLTGQVIEAVTQGHVVQGG